PTEAALHVGDVHIARLRQDLRSALRTAAGLTTDDDPRVLWKVSLRDGEEVGVHHHLTGRGMGRRHGDIDGRCRMTGGELLLGTHVDIAVALADQLLRFLRGGLLDGHRRLLSTRWRRLRRAWRTVPARAAQPAPSPSSPPRDACPSCRPTLR